MRYRIKIITYENGRKEFQPQIKGKWFGWNGLNYEGSEDYGSGFNRRQDALDVIDKNYKGNTRTQTIEFEYITRKD